MDQVPVRTRAGRGRTPGGRRGHPVSTRRPVPPARVDVVADHDSWNGMIRFRELVSETCGLYNTAGFNDDTRAYPSIPIRHDLARRVDANWIAGLLERQVIDEEDAAQMMQAAAYGLAKDAYRLENG